jgi:polysaccharide biosynthesis transport protein
LKTPNLPALPASRPDDLPATLLPQELAHPGLSIAQLLSIAVAYRMQIALITSVIVVIAAGAIKLMPKSYTAMATMMVSYEVSDPLGGKEIPANLIGSFMSTQIQLMQNPEVLFPVIEKLQLTKDDKYTAGYKGDGGMLRDWVMAKVQQDLLITQGASQLINISATAATPFKAMTIANTIGDVYSEQERSRASGPARERMRRYEEQLKDLKDKVTVAQDRLAEFRHRTGITDVAIKDDSESLALAELEQRLLDAQNQRRAAEIKAAGNQSLDNSVMGSNLIQGLKNQLNTQQAQLAQLSATLGAQHPKLVELRSQINTTQLALTDEIQTYAGSHSAELTAAKQLEQKLQQAVNAQRSKVLTARSTKDDGAKLQLELDSAQTLYKRALDGYDQIMFSTDRDANIRFVSRALLPVKASKPNKLKLLAMGVVAGGFLGLLGPLCFELLVRRRVRCRDDVERDLGIPVLAEFAPIKAIAGAA